jgi:hypothetical protein
MNGLRIRDAISPVVFLVGLVGLVAIALNLCDCKPAADPSTQMEAVVPALARGVKAADSACASLARAKMNADLARDCAFAYDAARLSLQAADDALDADVQVDVPCQVAQALAYARQMAGLIEKHGGKLPRSLSFALSSSAVLAGVCRG